MMVIAHLDYAASDTLAYDSEVARFEGTLVGREAFGNAGLQCDAFECDTLSCYSYSDPVICHCLQISEGQLIEVRTVCPLASLRDIARTTGAGTGCTACHRRLRKFINESQTSS
jgi:bacterioferritin-associated ferredoxin